MALLRADGGRIGLKPKYLGKTISRRVSLVSFRFRETSAIREFDKSKSIQGPGDDRGEPQEISEQSQGHFSDIRQSLWKSQRSAVATLIPPLSQ